MAIATPARPKAAQRPYEPYGAARNLFYDHSPEILIEGPAGTGKSRACLEKVHICACKYPGMRALVARKTRESMTESVQVTYEEKVLPENSSIKSGIQRRMRQAYHYPNGSEVVVGGMDKASKIMSTEYDVIYVPEATELTEDDWESLLTRLRNGVMPYQQIIGDCNPGGPAHFLNQRCNAGTTVRLLSRHTDNPAATSSYLAMLDRLTGVRRKRLKDGVWAAAEGLVYEFDHAVHLVDRFPIPPTWRRMRVIDFGYTNPFVTQWWAFDNDDRMYLYREIYRTQRIVAEHAKQITALSEGETYAATISDHDAEDRATLENEGIYTEPAEKAISPGIQAVQARLAPAGDGRPRLFVLRDSLVERDEHLADSKKPCSTLEEFDGYVWPKGQDGKSIKEEPVKADDHGMDCVRYATVWAENPGVSIWFI